MSSEDDFEEEEEEENPNGKSTPRRKARTRASFKEESSSEDEEEDSAGSNQGSSSESENDESDAGKATRKRKASKKTSSQRSSSTAGVSKKRTSNASSSQRKRVKTSGDGVAPKVKKAPTHTKLLENAMKANKWWEMDPLPEGMMWRTLEHNGVQFPPSYTPHGAAFLYDGQEVELDSGAEELATYFAACIGSQQLQSASSAKTFTANFFKEFKARLPQGTVIKEFAKCDFSRIRAHLDHERDKRKEMSKEEKAAKKVEEDAKKLKYYFALVDGALMKVANSTIEPPSLFRGRGEHPKAGLLKPRIMPEDITLNIGEEAPVPPCPIAGHSWGRIIHNHGATWLANWKDMSGNNKYVYLSASSHFKGQMDRDKYDKARRLKEKIPKIRKGYLQGMEHGESVQEKQMATATWIIDRLALRVGGEKEEGEADTVGTCSLRVEHVSLEEPATMTLDFLGKDSMRHFETYNLADEHYQGSGLLAFKCLKSFIKGKEPEDQIFDRVDPSILNAHLKSFMEGLTAKVFRTYNASFTLERELPFKMPENATLEEKLATYNDANRKVAILCNHQRSVSQAQEASLEKKQHEIQELEAQLAELQEWLTKVNKGTKIQLKAEDIAEEDKKKYSHMFDKQPSVEQVENRVEKWKKTLEDRRHKASEADKNKAVALNTSKINYMDPRISVAWAKRNEFPIEKIYSPIQRDKFPWAMSESDSFKF